ncbi:diaminohydroxyphosphoribosylaminopyrimidine deaminase/5-amino-6-(5-phosphoribosylamino)uracil reductase [Deinococcus budaensis]|uniref:Riboflavin biosynthesis protein RibD n=2 Tax=Deinococcus budaensis TaxID=1665626 RepID=A0A7W8GIA5_9DEIO|nr:bifunctional diaminohydroxyphosphoribosylaminopyrimidine deaminase/5-amino-6-(5-phosphoribosylamino)uracil reductase RibD [Deinococcus budaensis]MBB5235666.1 diaminohydroxyphosphoribosylaminopyrimidine deaminase/5-amino-6-(5-phosphoribosylamino)uracil reductase [Deinococcus budaensis]
MRLALEQAARGLGRTAPNPPVGCVLVREGEVIGRGFHPRAGDSHAEVFALREAGERARGAAAYVTLEPCSHFGRTPPCADALVAAGVARVVVAALDPNPQVAGRGVRRLREAGIEVTVGVGEKEALRQQAGFRSLVTRGRPWVIYKYAMTLDGKVAAPGEGGGGVTSAEARARVMRWRDEQDALAVGVGTVLADDPRLTTRGVPGGRDPRPVIFDRRARTPAAARALRPGAVVVTSPQAQTAPLEGAGAVIVRAGTLPEALRELGALNVSTLLLEGGPTLAGAVLEAGLVDEVRALIAPKLLGAGLSPLGAPVRPMAGAAALRGVHTEPLGPDLLISGLLNDIPRLSAGGEP